MEVPYCLLTRRLKPDCVCLVSMVVFHMDVRDDNLASRIPLSTASTPQEFLALPRVAENVRFFDSTWTLWAFRYECEADAVKQRMRSSRLTHALEVI